MPPMKLIRLSFADAARVSALNGTLMRLSNIEINVNLFLDQKAFRTDNLPVNDVSTL